MRIVGTNTQYLSTSIRICAKMNFRSLINNYRIRYSLELLRQPDNEKVNFRTFHAECGFLSRSAFYMSFKKRNRQNTQTIYEGACCRIMSVALLSQTGSRCAPYGYANLSSFRSGRFLIMNKRQFKFILTNFFIYEEKVY